MHPILYHGLQLAPGMRLLIVLAVIWTLAWKGIATWRAARNGQKAWFVFLFILNTLGILDIIYLLAFSKPKQKEKQ